MRHVYVNRAVIVLATLLVVAALLFAWARSEGLALALLVDQRLLERETETPIEGTAGDDGAARGEDVWSAHCSACHARLPHVPELAARAGGRSYLIDLVLFGFEGEATIDGERRSFEHPAFGDLADADLAVVLDHTLIAWDEDDTSDDVDRYRPEEIDEARDRDLAPSEVAERRPDG
jgi:mono/diheme cytochrome c family protein